MFALDISEEKQIRILEVIKKRKQLFVQGMAEGELFDINELPQVLQKLVGEATPNPIKRRELAFAIPEEKTFIKVIELPKRKPETLQTLLLEKISSFLPYAPEEIYWDWSIVDTKEALDHDDAIFVAAEKKTVDTYLDLITSAGFETMLIETEANALLWGALNPLDIGANIEPTMLVDFGTVKITIVIFAKGAIRFTTSIMPTNQSSAVGNSPSNKKNTDDELANQIKAHIDYYQEHLVHPHDSKSTSISKIILTGAWADIKKSVSFFEKKLKLPVREQPKIFPLKPSYITALGLALRGIYEET